MEQRTTALYFDEDEVVLRTGNTVKCGTVVESYADMYSEDENSSDDDGDILKPGKVRVAFYPTGQETLVDEAKLELIERSLMPGDIIRWNNGSGQKGFVTECNVICWLQIKGTNQIISQVSSKLLEDPHPYGNESIYVELDGWIGKSSVAEDYSVTLELHDNSRITVNADKLDSFDDVFDIALRKKEGSEFAFTNNFVGQKLKGPLKSIKKSEKSKRTVTVTVVQVKVETVKVNWLFCGCDNTTPMPSREVTGAQLDRLKPIDPFAHATAQLGDTFYYAIRPEDSVETIITKGKATVTQHILTRLLSSIHSSQHSNSQSVESSCSVQPNDDSDETKSDDYKEETTSSMAGEACGGWTDMDESCGGAGGASGDDWEDLEPSTPSHRPDRALKARRGNRKKTRTAARNNVVKSRELGLVSQQYAPGMKIPVEIVLSETFVSVIWQDGSVERDIPSRDMYSVYHLDDNEFFPGDYVAKADVSDDTTPDEYGVVMSVDESQRLANIKWFKTSPEPECLIDTTEVSVYEIKDHPVYKYRPGAAVIRVHYDDREDMQCCTDDAVGSVVELHCDGLMSIKWADGCVSQCYPEQLLLVGNMHEESDDEYSSSEGGDSDDSDDSLSDHGSSGDHIDPEQAADNYESTECMLKSVSEAISELMTNYERVLESVRDMQQNRTLLPWDDFNKILKTLSGAPVLYRKMLKLDRSLKIALIAIINKKEIWDLERSITKATCYGGLISSMLTLSDKLSDPEQTLSQIDITTFLSDILRGLESLPQADSEEEANFIVCVVSLVKKIQKLDKMKFGEKESDCTDELNVSTLGELCEQVSDDLRGDQDVPFSSTEDIQTASEESSKPSAKLTESQLLDSITAQIEIINETSKSNVQLEIIDSIIEFFSQMKSVTQTVLEAYNRHSEYINAIEDPSLKDEGAASGEEDIKTEDITKDEPLIKLEPSAVCDPKQETGAAASSNHESPSETLHTIKSDVKAEPKTESLEQPNLTLPSPNLPYDITARFVMLPSCPNSHHFFPRSNPSQRPFSKDFIKCIQSQLKALSENLTDGVYVRAYEDRMDCLSVMVVGPGQTPYEDALFTFDIWLPADYPHKPPVLYYHAYTTDRLNPNLYVDGKVCVSLLGTWSGKQHELWNPFSSNLLQVLISIQALILVKEPYFNEAGYDKQKETMEGSENSKKYNEMVLIKVIQSMMEMLKRPHESFKQEIELHWKMFGQRFLERFTHLALEPSSVSGAISQPPHTSTEEVGDDPLTKVCKRDSAESVRPYDPSSEPHIPDYPLLPLSRGCLLTLKKLTVQFTDTLKDKGVLA